MPPVLWQDQVSGVISSPLEVYRRFVTATMRPLSLTLTKAAPGPYHQLTKEVAELLASLEDKVEARTKLLSLGLPDNIRKKIKLSERELKLSVSRGAAMVQTFYPEHVIARWVSRYYLYYLHSTTGHHHALLRLKGGEAEFWSGRGLRQEDWVGLTSLLYSEIFSADFLTPMQEADTTFQLRVEHWNLTRYLNMVLESDWRDDTDVARAVHAPRGNIHIQSPYLDPSLFNPLAMTGTHLAAGRRRPGRRWRVVGGPGPNLLPRLCVPLPVPHPAEVAIIVYNRDHQDSGTQVGMVIKV